MLVQVQKKAKLGARLSISVKIIKSNGEISQNWMNLMQHKPTKKEIVRQYN